MRDVTGRAGGAGDAGTRDRTGVLLRLAAFTTDPAGGNPAGVWIGDALPDAGSMLRIAAEVGYSETAFLAPEPDGGPGNLRVRYFSPLAEVPFCGHATIASAIALAERGEPAELRLRTNDGIVVLQVAAGLDGRKRATLTSVAPWVQDADPHLVGQTLALLGWQTGDLSPTLAPAVAYAGAKHLVLVARRLERLATLRYPFDDLKRVMLDADLTTIALMVCTGRDRWRARNPFPVGGMVEDPATGAAAAAFGALLRERGMVGPSGSFTIEQGVEMGRRSLIEVTLVENEPGVLVTGTAVAIPEPMEVSREPGSATRP